MTTYSLQIQIDQAGVQTIAGAGLSVAILQPQSNASYQIVALMFPAANTTYVGWTDTQSVYTSSYSLQAYATLQINSQTSALPMQSFIFDGTSINPSAPTDLDNTVQLSNGSTGTVTSGLARAFTVNGNQQNAAIISATSVLVNGLGSFPLANDLMLTLLGGAKVGMALPSQVFPQLGIQTKKVRVTPQVTAQPPLLLSFSASKATQTVHFDDVNNVFVAGALQ